MKNSLILIFFIIFISSCSFFSKKDNNKELKYDKKEILKKVAKLVKKTSGENFYKKYEAREEIVLDYDLISKERYYKNNNAKRTLYLFFDFYCPYCKDAFYKLKDIADKVPDQVNLAFIPFPMDPSCNYRLSNKMKANDFSCRSVYLSYCISKDKTFAEAIDIIYKNKENIEDLERKYSKCLESSFPEETLKKDIKILGDAKFNGLPLVLLEGKSIARLYKSEKHLFLLLNYIDKVE